MSETPTATPCNIAAALPRLARERPEQVAMRCPGRNGRYEVALTYAQLDARSDAIAAGLALGHPLEVAVAEAWAYVSEAIRRAPGLGHGHGPLDHGWPLKDARWATSRRGWSRSSGRTPT